MDALYTQVNMAGVKPRLLSAQRLARLKSAFEYEKYKDGTLPVASLERIIDEANIDLAPTERSRVRRVAEIVGRSSRDRLRFDQCVTLVQNQVDVRMLLSLFDEANTDVRNERVEFFLDADEMTALLKRLDIRVDRTEIERRLEDMDKDADGRVDWEEFLTLCSAMLGSAVNVSEHDLSFDQLRSLTRSMDGSLAATDEVVAALERKIDASRAEIERRIRDGSLEDTRARLRAAWEKKDALELELLALKTSHFAEMKELLLKQDREKGEIVESWEAARRERDATRDEVDRVRARFRASFSENLAGVHEVQRIVAGVAESAGDVQRGLEEAQKAQTKTRALWAQCAQAESEPSASSNGAGLEYLGKQGRVMGEIKRKMEMMQRERDKYEDLIAAEVQNNKSARIDCVNLNMEITDLETEQMVMEEKWKDVRILNATLEAELARKQGDTDSKEVKVLKDTVFQFSAEREEVRGEVDRAKKRLRELNEQVARSDAKCSKLNVELGELKLLLEECSRIGPKLG
jgi:Ca2+-binding EF-hand superfamily protein